MPATRKAASSKSQPTTTTKTATKTATRSAAVPTSKRAAPAARRTPTTTAKTKDEATRQMASCPSIDPERRRNYVEVAAYYIAQRRGFVNGDETNDWLAAEEEIDRLLREKKLSA